MTEVLFIIPYWHGNAYLSACLQSISLNKLADDIHVSVLIVHNGGSEPLFPDSFVHNLTVIRTEDNIGFARAVNVGLNYAFSHQPDFIAILNQDTRLNDQCIPFLLENIDNTTALYSPVIMSYDLDAIPLIYLSKYQQKAALESGQNKYGVSLMSGVCIFGTLESFKESGYFDVIFSMYYEDDDYSKRFIERAGKLYLVTSAKVGHFGRSTESLGGSTILTRRTSSLKYMLRHSSIWAVLSKMIRDNGSFAIHFRIRTLLRCIRADISVLRLSGYLKNADYEMIQKRAMEMVRRDLPDRRR